MRISWNHKMEVKKPVMILKLTYQYVYFIWRCSSWLSFHQNLTSYLLTFLVVSRIMKACQPSHKLLTSLRRIRRKDTMSTVSFITSHKPNVRRISSCAVFLGNVSQLPNICINTLLPSSGGNNASRALKTLVSAWNAFKISRHVYNNKPCRA